MKNHWLDNKRIVSNDALTKAVAEYKDTESNKDQLFSIFKILVKNILKFSPIKFDNEDIVEDCIKMCFEKLHRYNPQKGKALNFFTMNLLSHMRQVYMTQKRAAEMKEANA